MDWVLRRLVRWLRRRRYARTADRIHVLQVRLGIGCDADGTPRRYVPNDAASMQAILENDHALAEMFSTESINSGRTKEFLSNYARIYTNRHGHGPSRDELRAAAHARVQQRATGNSRNYHADGDMVISSINPPTTLDSMSEEQRHEARDHDAPACPTRLEVTRFNDRTQSYIHGIECLPERRPTRKASE